MHLLPKSTSKHMKTLILFVATTLLALPAFGEGGKTDVASAVRQAEERWEAAILKKDSKTVGELVANDYAAVNDKGLHEDKAALLSRMDKETDTLTSAKLTDLKVHVYAPNVAVAIGDAAEKGADRRASRLIGSIVSPTPGWSAAGSGNASPNKSRK